MNNKTIEAIVFLLIYINSLFNFPSAIMYVYHQTFKECLSWNSVHKIVQAH